MAVTHGDAWGEDEVIKLSGNCPYSRIVQVESKVWPEVGVDRRDCVELGQVCRQNVCGPVAKQPTRTNESDQYSYNVQDHNMRSQMVSPYQAISGTHAIWIQTFVGFEW